MWPRTSHAFAHWWRGPHALPCDPPCETPCDPPCDRPCDRPCDHPCDPPRATPCDPRVSPMCQARSLVAWHVDGEARPPGRFVDRHSHR
eukprot:3949151-Prymnesium_polylepis.1